MFRGKIEEDVYNVFKKVGGVYYNIGVFVNLIIGMIDFKDIEK